MPTQAKAVSLEFDTTIPVPARRPEFGLSYIAQALLAQPVGASILVAVPEGQTHRAYHGSLSTTFNRIGGAGWYTARKQDGGIRVWKLREAAGSAR